MRAPIVATLLLLLGAPLPVISAGRLPNTTLAFPAAPPTQGYKLVQAFPEATGRDIKGLAKLVSKYCNHKGVEPSLAVFQRCSIFRGMEALPSVARSA